MKDDDSGSSSPAAILQRGELTTIYNVEGGIGIFGSMAGVSTDIYVQPMK